MYLDVNDFQLDLHRKNYRRVFFKNGDHSTRFLRIYLLDTGNVVPLESSNIVWAYAKRSDKTLVRVRCLIEDASKGIINVPVTAGLLALQGTLQMEIIVKENDTPTAKRLSFPVFEVNVGESLYSETLVDEEEVLVSLEDIMEVVKGKFETVVNYLDEVERNAHILNTEIEEIRIEINNLNAEIQNIFEESELARQLAFEKAQELRQSEYEKWRNEIMTDSAVEELKTALDSKIDRITTSHDGNGYQITFYAGGKKIDTVTIEYKGFSDNTGDIINTAELDKKFDDVSVTSTDSGTSLNFFANNQLKKSVLLDNIDTAYIRTTPVPNTIGGIKAGTTFNGTIADALDKLLYPSVNPTIKLSTNKSSQYEKGSIVDGIILNSTITLGSGNPISISFKYGNTVLGSYPYQNNKLTYSHSVTGTVTSNTTFTSNLEYEIDGTRYNASANTSINFLNKVYYGSSPIGDYNSSFILGLSNSVLTSSRNRTITVNSLASEYIYYAIPTSFGTPNFTVNGFSGGFEKVSTFNFTNINNYSESYDLWRSVRQGLGNTTITIT